MDTFKKKDYGTKIEYDPLWEGPMKTNRTRTDAGFLVGFVTFLSLWIVVGAVVVSQGYVPASSSPNDPSFDFSLAISEHKSVIIGMIFMGIVLAVGYIVALRWFAKFIVWSAVVLMILLILAGLIFTIKDLSRNASGSSYVGVGFQAIILIVIVVVAIVYRKKIKIACEVIREASKAHLTFASSFIILFIPAILYITSVGFFGVVALNARNLGLKNSGENDSTPFYIYAIHLFNFFGLLWSCSFVNGLTQMALAGAFGTWYWTHRKENIPRFTVLKSCKTVLVFHLGTVAFGSLVIAICQLIKSLFQALRSESGSSGNGFGRLMACWCGFVWENIEQFVKFMGRNAYVMSAIHGTGFFASAKDAFNLIMRNLVSTLILNNVIDAVLALGVLLVSGITAGVTYALVQKNVSQDSTLAAIIILVLIITLFFAVPIFMVLQVACDTIFLCVLEDYERHDDSETKPYYMSKRLKKLLLVDSEESI